MPIFLLSFAASAAGLQTELYPKEVISHHASLPLAAEQWIQPLATDSKKMWENIAWGVAGTSLIYTTVQDSLGKEARSEAQNTADYAEFAKAEEIFMEHKTRKTIGVQIFAGSVVTAGTLHFLRKRDRGEDVQEASGESTESE